MITPSFALDFTAAVLDSRVTFARTGNVATRVSSSGYIEVVSANVPRFDYNPITLACNGLLVEESRTNLATNSNNFPAWASSVGCTFASAAVTNPEGGATTTKMVENSGTVTPSIRFSFTSTVTAYTWSIFVKAAERSLVTMFFAGIDKAATFNLVTKEVMAASFGTLPDSYSIEDFKDGFYRCSITATYASAISTSCRFVIGNGASYAGDGVSGVYIYGAQNEVGSFPTSYIPTTVAVTRGADVATITGTNFSDFWNASKGGAMVQAIQSTVAGIRPLVQYDDGTAGNIIALRGNAVNPELQIVDGGAPQAQLDAGTIVANTLYSLTGWWQTNDCRARQNAGAVVIDNTATIPAVTQARLGSDGTNYLNGHLATINYYNKFTGQIYDRRKNKAVFSLF